MQVSTQGPRQHLVRPTFAIAVAAFSVLVAMWYAANVGYFETDTSKYAVINDITVRQGLDSGYRLIAVDDRPEKRRKGRFVTFVPVALVNPGNRKLTLQKKDHVSESNATIFAQLKQGTRYRIKLQDGKLNLVKDTDF
ncbi:hypothetical protein Poly24_08630 [Rosistilla carotiformis]|uniref:Uncharacterized protein n=1 Tax=Rosistilla carotiformis TaxID=2528017 RepID=A0A518JNT5_9BACT|nr:hypothetical protein [Rosistilla carotiformis]QDV67171.1 hypothetical protein Poly24_08630 [Rosistilla carotiformis]